MLLALALVTCDMFDEHLKADAYEHEVIMKNDHEDRTLYTCGMPHLCHHSILHCLHQHIKLISLQPEVDVGGITVPATRVSIMITKG